eukprot:gene3965-4016_t
MRSVAQSRGGECLSDKYMGMQTKLRWRCAHGHEWSTTPATVINRGSWCPDCSTGLGERLTRAAIEQLFSLPFPKTRPDWLVSERGTKLELDGYNTEIGIAFEHQGEQHFTEIAYFADEATFQQRLEDDQRKRELCGSRNILLIEVPQVGTKLKVSELSSWLETILVGQGIRSINRGVIPDYRSAYETSGAAAALSNLREIANSRGGDADHEWETPADSIIQGKWCPFCSAAAKAQKSRNPIEKIQDSARLRGGRLLSTRYVSSSESLIWEFCVRRSIDELRELAVTKGGKLLSQKYEGMQHPLEWQCLHGHQWLARPLNIANAAKRGGQCLSDNYTNARTKLRWKCAQGHEWDAVPHSIKAGTWCPTC